MHVEAWEAGAEHAHGVSQAHIRQLREALEGLVRRLEVVHEDSAYKAVWTSYHIHHGTYRGPQYTLEFESAQQALRDTQPKTDAEV